MQMTQFESLISELAAASGLALQVDAQDSCSLETDGIIVTLQYRRERDDVVLFAPVTEPDTDLPPETLRTALSLACHGEGTYGNFLGLFDGALILSALLPLEGLDAEMLAAHLLAFSDAAVAVRDALAASVSPDAASAEPLPGNGLRG